MGKTNIDIMTENFSSLGVKTGDTILMHSSLKSLFAESGIKVTPSEVVDSLLQTVGEDGTIVLPALSYMHCNKNNPVFDYYKTPSNIGALPEYFRTEAKGVIRSMCPTHSCCAAGKNATYITEGHMKDRTPCGANSPFRRVMELGGKLLFLGCGLMPNTSMHAVEELIEPDYLYGTDVEYTMIDGGGNTYKAICRSHGFDGVSQRYDRIEPLLKKGSEIWEGKVLDAHCYLLDACSVWEKAKEAYTRDNHYFIDKD